MIGTPPSQRPIGHDPAAHARDFAQRYAEDIDLAVAERMTELGIPNHQIGRPDPDHRGQWRAFFPQQGTGGGVVGNKINADAGLFDTDLMTRIYGPKIGEKRSRSLPPSMIKLTRQVDSRRFLLYNTLLHELAHLQVIELAACCLGGQARHGRARFRARRSALRAISTSPAT